MKRSPAILLCLALAACSANTPVINPTETATSSSPSPSATSTFVRSPSARQVVWADDKGLWTYDVKANSVAQFATGQAIRQPSWMGSSAIAFIQDEGTNSTLRKIDLRSKQVVDLFSLQSHIDVYGLSPDGQTIAYISIDGQGYPHVSYRLLAGDQTTQSVATLARVHGRDFVPDDEERIEYSHDGQIVLITYTPADGDAGVHVTDDASQLQIRGVDGSLLYGVDMAREPTMGVWSPDGTKVYYRTTSGVRAWQRTTGTSLGVSSTLKWYDPWPSPDGTKAAFDNGTFDSKVSVFTIDLKSGKKTSISSNGFAWPVFASAKTVWVQRANACTPDCPVSVTPGPEVFAIDLARKTQTKIALPTLQGIDVLYQ